MFKYKVFISLILFSGVTIGSWNFSAQNDTNLNSEGEKEVHQNYWSCSSVDAEQNIFSGWALTLEKAKDQAIENCSSYSEVDGNCTLSEDVCEQIEL